MDAEFDASDDDQAAVPADRNDDNQNDNDDGTGPSERLIADALARIRRDQVESTLQTVLAGRELQQCARGYQTLLPVPKRVVVGPRGGIYYRTAGKKRVYARPAQKRLLSQGHWRGVVNADVAQQMWGLGVANDDPPYTVPAPRAWFQLPPLPPPPPNPSGS